MYYRKSIYGNRHTFWPPFPPPPIKCCCCSLLWCQRSFPQKDFAVKVITLIFENIATNDKFHGAHLRQLCSEDQRKCSICSVLFNLIHFLDTVILFDVQPHFSSIFIASFVTFFKSVQCHQDEWSSIDINSSTVRKNGFNTVLSSVYWELFLFKVSTSFNM